jgi:hypothetical protein
MSVQLLSSVTPPEGSEQTEPEVRPGSIDNASLDRHLERGLQSYQDPEEAPPPTKSGKSLDTLISEGLDRYEKQERDAKAWDASLESRDSLRAQYSDMGNLDQTLRQFLGLYEQIKQDPINGADKAIRAFSEAAFRADLAKARMPKRDQAPVVKDPIYGGNFNGGALDNAISHASKCTASMIKLD